MTSGRSRGCTEAARQQAAEREGTKAARKREGGRAPAPFELAYAVAEGKKSGNCKGAAHETGGWEQKFALSLCSAGRPCAGEKEAA
jgi:hypothetical protein